MVDKAISAGWFWPYDVFGYLFPGFMLLAGYGYGNQRVHDVIKPLWDNQSLMSVLLVLGLAYMVGHLVSALSSLLLERVLLRRILLYPTQQMFPRLPTKAEMQAEAQGKFSVRSWAGTACRKASSYFRPYSLDFQRQVLDRFARIYCFHPADPHDLYWQAFVYDAEHHPLLYRRIMHFVELYGFARNACMSFLLLAVAPILPFWPGEHAWWTWSGAAFGIALVLFLNYTKLLRRQNDEVYRCFVLDTGQGGGLGG